MGLPVLTPTPSAKPVRWRASPGNTPLFDTFPYEYPPLSPNPPCARAASGAAMSMAVISPSVRLMRLLHPRSDAPKAPLLSYPYAGRLLLVRGNPSLGHSRGGI